MTTFINILS